MKKILLAIFVLLTFCAWAAPVTDKNNPLGIDNTCYVLYQEVEKQLGKEGFSATADLFLQAAITKKDDKAQVIYYAEQLKNLIARPKSEDNDASVDEARERLKQVAREKKQSYYFYYSYQLSQEYFSKHGEAYRALKLLQEMQNHALDEGDAYGVWTSSKYLADIYIRHNDYVSAKPHLLQAIKLYNTTSEESIRRESPTRLYCDLADTYPIASDSVRININLARKNAKFHLDSLRCTYYDLRIAALDNDMEKYMQLRDICKNDPQFPTITRNSRMFFSLIDACRDGSIIEREEDIYQLATVREMKVIANLCENWGHKEFAFNVEKKLVNLMEALISDTNLSRITELDVTMGKAALNAELVSKEQQLSRVSRLVSFLLAIVLFVTALLSLIHIRQLKKANQQVVLANAAKTRFVQNMSHEVRTPLNAIVGFSQLLALPDGSLTPEEKEEFSGHIVNNTKMLTMLLDDILNASSMDKGEYRITYEEGEKNFMCLAAISSAEHRLQPGVKMYYVPEEEEPFTFRTDPRRVQQILINLLTNSCKHTTEGEIRLARSLAENPGFVTFSVTDTGSGVPADQAEKIFERFTKLNEFVQGTGLGLSICRDIATRMGAKVLLDTNYPGPGARFVFIVPINPEEK